MHNVEKDVVRTADDLYESAAMVEKEMFRLAAQPPENFYERWRTAAHLDAYIEETEADLMELIGAAEKLVRLLQKLDRAEIPELSASERWYRDRVEEV